MAYMSQEKKQELAPKIRDLCKKYGIKATIAVRNHSTLVVNISQGEVDFIGSYRRCVGESRQVQEREITHLDVNPYWYHDHFDGKAKEFLSKLFPIMNDGNHDNSDIQTDYFDVGWYVDVNIGRWNKPYALIK